MNSSESLDKLAQALTSAQAELEPVEYDSVNPYYKSKYASLGSLIARIREVLPKHGLSYMQLPISEGWTIGVDNILMHISGQWISQKYFIPLDTDTKNPIQESGKALTYARRYGLASMLGMYADEDIDANTSEQQKNKQDESKESEKETTSVESLIKTYWIPMAKLAEKMKIEFEPLPPNPTEPEFEKAYLELQEKIEGAK